MMKRTLTGVVVALCVTAVGASGAAPALAARPGATRIAELVLSRTPVHVHPGGRIERVMRPETGHGSRVYLRVMSTKTDAQGRDWYQVLLPTRPNGSTGWVRADRVHTRWTSYRIQVSTRTRKLQLLQDDRVVLRTRVVVGKPSTPTPAGNFAIYARYSARGTPLAPRVMELTAHSNVLHEYSGGPGRIAIHGMAGPLLAPVGTALSHGCIRVAARPLNRLARLVPLGTPVRVTHHSLGWLNSR